MPDLIKLSKSVCAVDKGKDKSDMSVICTLGTRDLTSGKRDEVQSPDLRCFQF